MGGNATLLRCGSVGSYVTLLSPPTPPKYRRVANPPAVARGRTLYTASPTCMDSPLATLEVYGVAARFHYSEEQTSSGQGYP